MTVDISILTSGIVAARVSGASDDADTVTIVKSLNDAVCDNDADCLLLDLSDQATSTMTAVKARGFLAKVDNTLAVHRPGPDSTLAIAIAAPLSSLGYGIGRMIAGHAYDLVRLQVELFDSADAGMQWLTETQLQDG